MTNKPECTHILNQRGALILVVVKLLLPPQVLLLGRLKTHGDHLCTGQHLAAFDAICTSLQKEKQLLCVCVF